ncbi:MAG TPA: acyl carrier protein [Thermodesulfobacteriota bacterium]|nr:acyl carrier protein [Thermodesulfobacteriota bacterium]
MKKVLSSNILKDSDTSGLSDDTPLIEYGVGVDSVSRLEFLVALEEEFCIRLDESEITPEFFETVSGIAGFISRRVG